MYTPVLDRTREFFQITSSPSVLVGLGQPKRGELWWNQFKNKRMRLPGRFQAVDHESNQDVFVRS